MDKELIVLIIANNGLDTAQSVLEIKAAEAQRAAENATDSAERKRLQALARRRAKLVSALKAAEVGLQAYISETLK